MGDLLSDLAGPVGSIIGGVIGDVSQGNLQEQNLANQKEFAQQGVQWKVADAQAAGISPLAALGASTISYQDQVGGNPLGEGISQAGQDVSRAAYASQPVAVKDQHTQVMNKLAEKKGELELQYLGSQIAKMNQGGPSTPGPDVPIPGYQTVKNRDGSLSVVPAGPAVGEGFFPMSRYDWEVRNRLIPLGQSPSTGGVGFLSRDGGLDDDFWKRITTP